MDQVTEDQKQSLTKVFAIVGFIALIIIAVWLAVNIVRVVPNAFSSLASIAESVSNYSSKQQQLEVATQNSVINAGESATITWTKMRKDGVYSFSYSCTDGVSIDAKDISGKIITLTCNTPLLLSDKTAVDILVASEKARFVDVPYTITFTPTDTKVAPISTTKSITVVNATIPTTGKPATTVPATTTTVPATVTGSTTPTKTTLTAGTPTTIKKVWYTMPVSDPNGHTDLKVTYIGVGVLNGNTFTQTQNITVGQQGAIQFQVKNIGTKTADVWSYVAQLPADVQYVSGAQTALKPNERAIITLGFRGITQTGFQKFGVTVTANGDIDQSSNVFTWAVNIVN